MDTTSLTVAVDSTQVKTAAQQLDEFAAAGGRAEAATTRLSSSAARQQAIFDRMSGTTRKNVLGFKSLEDAVAQLGPNAERQLGKLASQLGQVAVPAAATSSFQKAADALGTLSLRSAMAKRELLVLGSEVARGDLTRLGASLFVLGEYTGAAPLVFSAMGAAVAGVVAVLGAFAYAAYKGAQQAQDLNNAITLTNNALGTTQGQFFQLTRDVSQATGVAVGTVRDFALALAKTGEFGPQVFEKATAAAAAFGAVAGKSAQEVAKEFAKMPKDPAKWIVENNAQLHAFTATQYESARAFQEQGDQIAAQNIVLDAMNSRFGDSQKKLEGLNGTLHEAKVSWSEFWDTVMGNGRPETIDDQIKKVRERLARIQEQQSVPNIARYGGRRAATNQAMANATSNELATLEWDKDKQDQNAMTQAVIGQIQNKAIGARSKGDDVLLRTKGTAELIQRAKDQAKKIIDEAAAGDKPYTPREAQRITDQLVKEASTNRHEDVSTRRATLQFNLDDAKQKMKVERDEIVFQNKFLEDQYKNGEISVFEYYQKKNENTAHGVDIDIAEIQKERDFIKGDIGFYQSKGLTHNVVELNKQLKDLDYQEAAARVKGAHDTMLANELEAKSYREVADRVAAFREETMRLQGNEAGVAKIETERALAKVEVTAGQITPKTVPKMETPGDFARFDRQYGTLPVLATQEVQDRKQAIIDSAAIKQLREQTAVVTQTLAVQEEKLATAVATGSKSELDQMREVSQFRKEAVVQLEKFVTEQEQLAARNPLNLRLQLDTLRARQELAKLEAELDPLAKHFNDLFKDSFSSTITDLINGKFIDPSKAQAKISQIERDFTSARDRIATDPRLTSRQKDTQIFALEQQRERDTNAAKSSGRSPFDQLKGAALSFGGKITGEITSMAAKEAASKLFGKDGIFKGGVGDLFSKLLGGKPGEVKLSPIDEAAQATATQLTAFNETGLQPAITELGLFKAALSDTKDGILAKAGATQSTGGMDVPTPTAEEGLSPLTRTPVSGQTVPEVVTGSVAEPNTLAANSPKIVQGEWDTFGKAISANSTSLLLMSAMALKSGNALALLPAIIQIIASTSAMSKAASSGGGFFDGIMKLFGGGSATSAGSLGPGSMGNDAYALALGADGGLLRGPKHSAGGIKLEAEGGEYIVKANQTRKYLPLIRAINNDTLASSFKKYAEGGIVNAANDNFIVASANRLEVAGNRELGGTTDANRLYRVNERGPELLEIKGRQYLMSGNEGGEVKQLSSAKNGDTIIQVNVTPPVGSSRQTAMQWGATAGRHIAMSTRRNGG